MKTYLLLAACMVLCGCGHERDREIQTQLEAIKTRLAAVQPAPVRWAFANKNDISTAIYKWRGDKLEAFKQSEKLSPDDEQKVQAYDALGGQLGRVNMERMQLRFGRPMSAPNPQPAPPATDKDLAELTAKVAEARVPVEAIIARREHAAAEFNNQFSVEQLVAEYVKGRYDLVLDDSYQGRSDKVLYRTTGEVTDITEGVLKLFQEKAK